MHIDLFRCEISSLTGLKRVVQGTDKAAKNELLFRRFGINYTDLPDQFKKGSVLFWDDGGLRVAHVDIIKDEFWTLHPEVLK